MTRQEPEHIIRAPCELLGVESVVILGGQSILASYPNVSGIMTKSDEADFAIKTMPGDPAMVMDMQVDAARGINARLGEGTLFD